MELDVKMDQENNVMRVKIAGDLDANVRNELKQGLESNIDLYKPAEVVIECEGLNYIDSTGLGVLVAAMNKVKSYDGKIRIVDLKPFLQKIFRVTGLTEIFEIEEAD